MSEKTLQRAREHVAEWKRTNAVGVFTEDAYAAHVTQATKDAELYRGFDVALEIEAGDHDHEFWCAQRIEMFLTGVCRPLLP